MGTNLEEQITQGKALWITSFVFELIECSSKLFLTSDPDSGKADRVVEFSGISSLSVSRFHDSGDACFGDFLGLNMKKKNGRFEYLINTGDSEVCFEAAVEPILTSLV